MTPVAHLGPADAMDPAEPLLVAVEIPRQVVIDHQVGPLVVDVLARGIRASGTCRAAKWLAPSAPSAPSTLVLKRPRWKSKPARPAVQIAERLAG